MTEFRLRKLPDRTPVKLALTISPELNQALLDYASLYGEVYGQTEPVTELVPAMLEAFLASDRGFLRHRRRNAGRPQ